MEQVAEHIAEQEKALDLWRGTGEQIKKHFLVALFTPYYYKSIGYYLFFLGELNRKITCSPVPKPKFRDSMCSATCSTSVPPVPLPVPHYKRNSIKRGEG